VLVAPPVDVRPPVIALAPAALPPVAMGMEPPVFVVPPVDARPPVAKVALVVVPPVAALLGDADVPPEFMPPAAVTPPDAREPPLVVAAEVPPDALPLPPVPTLLTV